MKNAKALVSLFGLVALFACLSHGVHASYLLAGAAKVDATLPVGAPLAGYNHGERRVPHWPDPVFTKYTTFMTPSQGVLDPTWVKALVIDAGTERVCFVSLDLMCADSSLAILAWAFAAADGFSIPLDKITFSGSHTHSGPGAWVSQIGIQITPTMDLFVPPLQQMLAKSIAKAMVEAERALQPASIGINFGLLTNVTDNRRGSFSPYVSSTTIDPNVGVLRVDSAATGKPIATLWNFAVHGVCYGPSNMKYSSDIMGVANTNIESTLGGIALFINGDAGDISPTGQACSGAPNFLGGITMANTVMAIRTNTTTSKTANITASSVQFDMGLTQTNWTLARNENCTQGGPFDICSICAIVGCDLNLRGGQAWVEELPRFTSFRFDINGQKTLFTTIPGEAIVELGWQIRNDSLSLGFDNTFLVGYSNNYLMYFTTPNEYLVGGYEASLTLWGIDTAEKIRTGCFLASRKIAPKPADLPLPLHPVSQ